MKEKEQAAPENFIVEVESPIEDRDEGSVPEITDPQQTIRVVGNLNDKDNFRILDTDVDRLIESQKTLGKMSSSEYRQRYTKAVIECLDFSISQCLSEIASMYSKYHRYGGRPANPLSYIYELAQNGDEDFRNALNAAVAVEPKDRHSPKNDLLSSVINHIYLPGQIHKLAALVNRIFELREKKREICTEEPRDRNRQGSNWSLEYNAGFKNVGYGIGESIKVSHPEDSLFWHIEYNEEFINRLQPETANFLCLIVDQARIEIASESLSLMQERIESLEKQNIDLESECKYVESVLAQSSAPAEKYDRYISLPILGPDQHNICKQYITLEEIKAGFSEEQKSRETDSTTQTQNQREAAIALLQTYSRFLATENGMADYESLAKQIANSLENENDPDTSEQPIIRYGMYHYNDSTEYYTYDYIHINCGESGIAIDGESSDGGHDSIKDVLCSLRALEPDKYKLIFGILSQDKFEIARKLPEKYKQRISENKDRISVLKQRLASTTKSLDKINTALSEEKSC